MWKIDGDVNFQCTVILYSGMKDFGKRPAAELLAIQGDKKDNLA